MLTYSAPEQIFTSVREVEALGVPFIEVPQAAMLDYDRTMGDPVAALNHLMLVVKKYNIDAEVLQQEARRVEQDGGSYEPLTAVRRVLAGANAATNLDELTRAYVSYPEGPQQLYPDTAAFIDRLSDAKDYPYLIGTTTKNVVWQREFKLARSRCSIHAEYLSDNKKGPYTRSLESPDGSYDFAVYEEDILVAIARAGSMAIVDDKPACLHHLRHDGVGYLVRRDGPILHSQRGVWDEHLTVKSLAELAVQEGRLVKVPSAPIPDGGPSIFPAVQRVFRPIRYSLT